MADTDARTPGTPIKPPDAAYRLEAWLGRADAPRLELAGPGEYNELLQAAQQSWARLETFFKGGLKASESQEVERRLQQLARDRYFLPLTEANVETLLRVLREAGTRVDPNAVVCACRILAAWVRRVSVQPGPTWTSKQFSAIVDSACTALSSVALDGAVGSLVYVLGAAAAAPLCPPTSRSRCHDEIRKTLQHRRTGITHVAQFPDALIGIAYLIPVVHGAPLASDITALLHFWTPLPDPALNSALNPLKNLALNPTLNPAQNAALNPAQNQALKHVPNPARHPAPNPQPLLSQALALSRLMEFFGAQLAKLAASPDFSNRALGLADAKAVQASLASGLPTEGSPASCAAILALAGFYQGLGFSGLTEVTQQQQTLLVNGASSASRGGQNLGGDYSHWLRCVALASARCKVMPGSPLNGHPAILACLNRAILGDLLSLQSIHQAVLSRRGGGNSQIDFAASSLRERVESEAFSHVGPLTRAFCDHFRAASETSRTGGIQSVLEFVHHLEENHRAYAMVAPQLVTSTETKAAVKKVLDASFLAVTVFCATLFPAGKADSGKTVTCLEVLSRVEFCRVPFAEYGLLVTRAVELVAKSRTSAEALARRMPPYAETTEFFVNPSREANTAQLSGSVEEPRGEALPHNQEERKRDAAEASTSGRSQSESDPNIRTPEKARWALDSVHSARVHFMLRVLAPCIENIGDDVFADVLLPTLLLFLLHPSAAMSKSAHVLFSAFLESRQKTESKRNATERKQLKSLWVDEGKAAEKSARPTLLQKFGLKNGFRIQSSSRASVPERAALFYVERSLAGFPGLTSFEAFTAGVAAIVRHVTPGSPAIVLILRRIATSARGLFERNVPFVLREGEATDGKGPLEGSAGGQLMRLTVHLIPIVDIQVLTGLLSEVEGVVLSIPDQTLQQAALAELYEVLAANEDYTRKAHCTVWYQHLAAKCVAQFRTRLKQGRARAKVGAVNKNAEADKRAWSRMWGVVRPRVDAADMENVAP